MRRGLVVFATFGALACHRGEVIGGGVTMQRLSQDAEALGLVLACGLTREAAADTMQEEHEAVGCALLDGDTRRKTQAEVKDMSVTFTLASGQELTPAATAAKSTNWHVFLQLPGGELAARTRLSATAVVDGKKISAAEDGAALFDPEGVAARAKPVAPALEDAASAGE